jgi:hypothetical protein
VRQAEELGKIKSAVPSLLNRLNWDEFLRVPGKAGFRSRKMITSDTALLYTYALWLVGRERYAVGLTELRDLMARWLFMAQITGRYTSSPETIIQRDLDRVAGAEDAAGYAKVLEGVIATTLTPDFWSIRLPEEFISSSTAVSPSYQAYLAALNILDAELFMLHERVRDWTDPTATSVKNVERHHLFPRSYLRDALGYTDLKRINQVANFVPTDWATNNLISDRSPHDYWPDLLAARDFTDETLQRQRRWHGLPDSWTALPYEEFLNQRRKLIAVVVRDGFLKLGDSNYQPPLADPHASTEDLPQVGVSLLDLMNAGWLSPGDILTSTDGDREVLAEVNDDGELLVDDNFYDTPDRAARAVGDETIGGWEFWAVVTSAGSTKLSALRDQLIAAG